MDRFIYNHPVLTFLLLLGGATVVTVALNIIFGPLITALVSLGVSCLALVINILVMIIR